MWQVRKALSFRNSKLYGQFFLAACLFAASCSNPSTPTRTVTASSAPTAQSEAPVFIKFAMPAMAWDGQYLWQYVAPEDTAVSRNRPAQLRAVNLQGELQPPVYLDTPLPPHKSITWGKQHLWLLDYDNQVHQVTRQGKVLASYELKALEGDDKAEKIVWDQDDFWVLEKNYPQANGRQVPARFSKVDLQSGTVRESFEVNFPGFEALFENLATDGRFFYTAKSSSFASAKNNIYSIDMQSHKVQKRSLKRRYSGIHALFFQQDQLFLLEQMDIRGCPGGCRGFVHPIDPQDPQRVPRPELPDDGGFRPPGPNTLPPEGPNARPPGAPPGGSTDLSSFKLAIGDYVIPVIDSFQVLSESSALPPVVEKARQQFRKDIETGQLQTYFQTPSFSIQMVGVNETSPLLAKSEGSTLLAKSEGSNFYALEANLRYLPPAEAAYAQLLVLEAGEDEEKAFIYRGRYDDQRFYFQGLIDVAPENTAYLITLDQDLNTQVLSGRVQSNPGITPEFIENANDPGILSEAEIQRIQAALELQRENEAEFSEVLDNVLFVSSDRLPPMMRSRVLLKLLQAHPEIASDIFESFGYSPAFNDDRIRALSRHYKEKYPEFFADADPEDPFVNLPNRAGR